jgi:hypothetical protein
VSSSVSPASHSTAFVCPGFDSTCPKFKPIVRNSLYCEPCTHLSLCVKYGFPRFLGDRCPSARIPLSCTRENVAADLLLVPPKTPMFSKLQSLLHTKWPILLRLLPAPVSLASSSPLVVHSPPVSQVASVTVLPSAHVVTVPVVSPAAVGLVSSSVSTAKPLPVL